MSTALTTSNLQANATATIYEYPPLSFKPGMSTTVMAKSLVAAMIVLPALLILGVGMGVRRFRRRRIIKG